MLHVLPADEISQPVLIVAGWVELIERSLLVVGRILVASRLIVFAE